MPGHKRNKRPFVVGAPRDVEICGTVHSAVQAVARHAEVRGEIFRAIVAGVDHVVFVDGGYPGGLNYFVHVLRLNRV